VTREGTRYDKATATLTLTVTIASCHDLFSTKKRIFHFTGISSVNSLFALTSYAARLHTSEEAEGRSGRATACQSSQNCESTKCHVT
jgi:hypothetical protein